MTYKMLTGQRNFNGRRLSCGKSDCLRTGSITGILYPELIPNLIALSDPRDMGLRGW